MDTADVLRRKRAKLVGQLEFIDELLAEMAEGSDPPAGAVSPRVATPATAPARPAAPKADPSAPASERRPRAVGKIGPPDVARHLAGGPRPLGELAAVLDVTGPTVKAVLEANPGWFRKAQPDNRLSPWELTEAGRRESGGGH
jgi:hypothetical protein